MKVPFTTQQTHQSVNTKSVSAFQGSNNNSSAGLNFSCYEPKSVLELRRSPSPTAADKPPSNVRASSLFDVVPSSIDDPTQLDDHGFHHLEDWDSLMREWGLHDESNSNPNPALTSIPQLTPAYPSLQFSSLPELPSCHSFDPTQFIPSDFPVTDLPLDESLNSINQFSDFFHGWNVGFDFVDELIRVAECFETNSVQLAQVILARLNQRLRSPVGRPLQRTVFYFKEALQSLLNGSTGPNRPSTSSEVVQAIKAYKAFCNVSPIPLFSSFTANQAIIEAVDGSMLIHVIDFDIGLGGQWASFMKEIADKADYRKLSSPILRITAVVPEEYAIESKLIRENLSQFARELNIGFEIEFVLIRTFEYLSFKAIRFVEGEKTAVLLSPTIFRRVGAGFINDLRRISPQVIVHVDSEGLMSCGAASFRQTVIEGLEFYSTVLESLDAAGNGGGGEWIRKIETFVLLPKIFAAVEASGHRGMPWRETLAAAGMRPVCLSQFADLQAECLLRRVQVRGFHVAKRQAEMVLCWHERPLVATSAWRC